MACKEPTPRKAEPSCDRCGRDFTVPETNATVPGTVRWDEPEEAYLCNDCWARIDPIRYGKRK